uniref:Retrotransposon gag protein n=1 Tax=Solanum tuberosum TaxID=4113 RepID=M1DUY8_SOLTU
MGMSSSTREHMEFPPLEVMMFRDRILTFKQLEGEWIHEVWARFKSHVIRFPTHEIPDIVFLDCFYKSLGPRNKALADRLIPGGITHHLYAIAAHIFDHMAEANQELEKDFMLAALMTHMDELVKNIVEIEVQCKRKVIYVPPHERRKPKDNEGKRVEEMLSIILNKVSEHDRVLEKVKENIKLMKQMINSHSRSIQLLENLTGHVMPHLYPAKRRGLPYDVLANPKSEV